MEILNTIIAAIALVLSVCTLILQRSDNKKEQNYIFFEKLFLDFIFDKVLIARQSIRFDEQGLLCGNEEMEKLLTQLGNDIQIYSYIDSTFHDKLKKKIVELDEFILSNNKYIGKEQSDYFISIDRNLSEMFEIILKKYFVS